jgi:hypothetical protein
VCLCGCLRFGLVRNVGMVRRKPHVPCLFVDVKKGGLFVCYLRFL